MIRSAMIAAAGVALAALAAPHEAKAETACADLAATKLAHAEVTAVTTETLGQAQACKIAVTSRPTADSEIRIEVWIPVGAAWNGRYVQVGNGGFAGQIPGQLRGVASQGYAAAGTDDGHRSADLTNASWALGHPEKVVDFAWRALKETTEVSKALIAAQKGRTQDKAYFYGCSDGGREALMEAQRFPEDFDGIVAGAPAYDMSHLFAFGAAIQQALATPGGYLGADQRALLQSAALAQCGDGGDFIRDPAACRFDPASLLCKPGEEGAKCLTPVQLATAQVIYGGVHDPRDGRLMNPGFSPGAEALPASWPLWTTGATADKRESALNFRFSSSAFKDFAFGDPSFDMLKLDMGGEFSRGWSNTRILDSTDHDLKAFRAHGGKLVNYHGWNDPAIPPKASILYYEQMARETGASDDFYRLYLVPGMLHCGGGPGPSGVEWLSVLDDWVRGGKRPDELTATGPAGTSQTLCPYPAAATKAGGCAAPVKQ